MYGIPKFHHYYAIFAGLISEKLAGIGKKLYLCSAF